MESPIDNFSSRTFAEQMNTTFHLSLPDGATVPLQLTTVTEQPTPPGVEAFSLLFLGPATPRLVQRIYPFAHEKLGQFELFITAVAGDASSTTYESVFNRLRRTQP